MTQLVFKCTTVVQKALKLNADNLTVAGEDTHTIFGNWVVNQFKIGRSTAYIFMSEKSLLSFILLKGRNTLTATKLPELFLMGLDQLLTIGGYQPKDIEFLLSQYQSVGFSKTDSRPVIGNMNDLVHLYQYMVEYEGGLSQCNLSDIMIKINKTPQRNIGWLSSWKFVDQQLQLLATRE